MANTSERTRELLRSKSTEDRIKGAQRLITSSGDDRLELLLGALCDKNTYVAALAAEALAEDADLTAAPTMTERFNYLTEDGMKRDPGCHIRAYLAYGLARCEYRVAEDALLVGIRTYQVESVGGTFYDTAAHLRANCALALAHLGSLRVLRYIAIVLFEEPSLLIKRSEHKVLYLEPQKAAARALAMVVNPDASVPLIIRLTHTSGASAEVLQQCMTSLVDLCDDMAPEVLLTFARGDDPNLAIWAGLELARIPYKGVERLFSRMIDEYFGDALEAAILALASVRTDEAQQMIKQLGTHERSVVVKSAIAAGVISS